MNFRTLIFRSLRFHWRAHLGVVLGAAVGSAALIGALVVGDSVRGSLREMALQRLGWVHFALAPDDGFFTGALPGQVARSTDIYNNTQVDSALSLPGTAARQDGTARANQVNVFGVDGESWGPLKAFFTAVNPQQLPSGTVALNEPLAAQLKANPGDDIILRIPKPGGFSREVPIATQNDSALAMRLKVHAIAGAEELGNFSLRSSQLLPLNAFVRMDELQKLTALGGKQNLLLVGKIAYPNYLPSGWTKLFDKAPAWLVRWLPANLRRPNYRLEGPMELDPRQGVDALSRDLSGAMRLEDAELEFARLTNTSSLELRSPRIFLPAPVLQAAMNTKGATATPSPVLTYLVNQFRAGTNTTPYSMVTAASEPWTPAGMKDDEILVNQWLAEDLNLKVGDSLDLVYFLPESAANLVEATNRLRVRGIVPLEGVYADRTLMPEFPGLAKAESTHDWDAGFPLVHKIRDKDEDYWKKHRGTPKAYVTLSAGQRMWGNRFGDVTAIRWSVPPASFERTERQLRENLLTSLTPASLGLRFEPVRAQALQAANQSQDFGQLFLGFSFFLIAAALILMALLFQFGLEQRLAEIGTLLALGFTPKQVRRIFLGEALALSVIGACIGVAAGIAYARGMLLGLGTIWRAAVQTSALGYHAQPVTLLIGFCSAIIICTLTIAWVMRKQAKRPAYELLAGGLEPQDGPRLRAIRRPLTRRPAAWIAILSLLAGLALVVWPLASRDTAAAGLFFGAGALMLIAGLALTALFLSALGLHAAQRVLTIASLGIRGSTRRRKRSVATVALLACGTFIIIAVGANRLEAGRDASKRSSGTGGFALIGQSSLPVVHDLNTERGRDFFSLDPATMQGVQVVPMRVRDGDDASCLNLNRAQKPRVIGVHPALLAERNAFTFASVLKGSSPGWNLLIGRKTDPADNVTEIPAIGDHNSILWAMGKKVGDTVDYVDERGNPLRLRLVASVANSILQGNLLIADENFRAAFPGESGYRMFLVDAPPARVDDVSAGLSRALQNYGLELTPAAARLDAFNAVQNTYLSTFQVLGGLGLLLGSVGLGIVVLRNVLERRGELALLQAVGWRRRTLHWLVLSEHAGLLWLGLGIGIAAALIAILPVFLAPGSQMHSATLILTLLAVFANGMLWTWLATRLALKGELLGALRNE